MSQEVLSQINKAIKELTIAKQMIECTHKPDNNPIKDRLLTIIKEYNQLSAVRYKLPEWYKYALECIPMTYISRRMGGRYRTAMLRDLLTELCAEGKLVQSDNIMRLKAKRHTECYSINRVPQPNQVEPGTLDQEGGTPPIYEDVVSCPPPHSKSIPESISTFELGTNGSDKGSLIEDLREISQEPIKELTNPDDITTLKEAVEVEETEPTEEKQIRPIKCSEEGLVRVQNHIKHNGVAAVRPSDDDMMSALNDPFPLRGMFRGQSIMINLNQRDDVVDLISDINDRKFEILICGNKLEIVRVG